MEFRARATMCDVLVDIGRWPEWDPRVERVDGQATLGGKIRVHTNLPSLTIPVEVVELEPPSRMIWRGGMPLGLMTGTRTLSCSETSGSTTFDLHEVFTGPLVGIMRRFMPDLQPSCDAHVAGLRTCLEG